MSRIPWATAPSTGNAQVDAFLQDVLDAIRTTDRQGIADLGAVSGTAGPTYTPVEQGLLNDLIALANGLRSRL